MDTNNQETLLKLQALEKMGLFSPEMRRLSNIKKLNIEQLEKQRKERRRLRKAARASRQRNRR